MASKETQGIKRGPVVLLTTLIVIATLVCSFALSGIKPAAAENDSMTGKATTEQIQDSAALQVAQEAEEVVAEGAEEAESDAVADEATSADNCKVTIKYYEVVMYDDPDVEVDSTGRRLLGTREIDNLREGDTLNAWNYVVNLPGHFFFDGWPQELVVSTDPSQNVIELMYVKLWNAEYTVNYYVMTGADLTADNWHDALAPDDVEFIKIASETFDNQRFDALIKGDAYEYKIDDMYVIDTYPAEIHLGTDPDNNVINVLYTPTSSNLPDDLPIPDDVIPPASDDTGSGDNGAGDSSSPTTPTLPDDETFDKDDMITTLPDNVGEGSDEFDDFLGSDIDRGELDVTDDMLAKPVNKEDAETTIKAYETGLHEGSLAQTGEQFPLLAVISGSIALIALIILIAYIVLNKRKTNAQATSGSEASSKD
jgi:predicted RecA/RadA family phage recombinase